MSSEKVRKINEALKSAMQALEVIGKASNPRPSSWARLATEKGEIAKKALEQINEILGQQ